MRPIATPLLVILIAAIFHSFSGKAQGYIRKNIVTANLFSSFVQGTPIINYERVVSKKTSFLVSYGQKINNVNQTGANAFGNLQDQFVGYNSGGASSVEQNYVGNSYFNVEFRYYFLQRRQRAPTGFHIGPSINFTNMHEQFILRSGSGLITDTKHSDYRINSFNISMGMQLLIKNLIPIDFVIAPGYGNMQRLDAGMPVDPYKRGGFNFKVGLCTGLAFGKGR